MDITKLKGFKLIQAVKYIKILSINFKRVAIKLVFDSYEPILKSKYFIISEEIKKVLISNHQVVNKNVIK